MPTVFQRHKWPRYRTKWDEKGCLWQCRSKEGTNSLLVTEKSFISNKIPRTYKESRLKWRSKSPESQFHTCTRAFIRKIMSLFKVIVAFAKAYSQCCKSICVLIYLRNYSANHKEVKVVLHFDGSIWLQTTGYPYASLRYRFNAEHASDRARGKLTQ